MKQQASNAAINQWGNSLAVRLNKSIVKAAGMTEGTHVRIIAQRGRIIVETVEHEPSLDEMLAAFDPKRHRGEIMNFAPVGNEVIK